MDPLDRPVYGGFTHEQRHQLCRDPQHPDKYGMRPIVANQANSNRYLASDLVERRVNVLRGDELVVLTGCSELFRAHHFAAYTLLTELEVPRRCRDGPRWDYHWESGRLDEAVRPFV